MGLGDTGKNDITTRIFISVDINTGRIWKHNAFHGSCGKVVLESTE